MTLYIISGPSQAGKTTIVNLLLKDKDFERVITATSRKPRDDEKNKIDYYFLKEDYFKDKSKFVETALVHGNYYGTLKKEVEDKLKSGKKIIWVMDVQGVNNILSNYKELPKDIITIFLTPTKISTLLDRIKIKNDPNIDERIKSIKKEMSYLSLFKYIVLTSKKIEETLSDLNAITNKDVGKMKKLEKETKDFDLSYFLNN